MQKVTGLFQTWALRTVRRFLSCLPLLGGEGLMTRRLELVEISANKHLKMIQENVGAV
jgi:hypothetical protein